MPVKAASLNDLDEPPKLDDEDDDEENAMFAASYCGLGVICTRDRFARWIGKHASLPPVESRQMCSSMRAGLRSIQ
jgi:hypothetical protein